MHTSAAAGHPWGSRTPWPWVSTRMTSGTSPTKRPKGSRQGRGAYLCLSRRGLQGHEVGIISQDIHRHQILTGGTCHWQRVKRRGLWTCICGGTAVPGPGEGQRSAQMTRMIVRTDPRSPLYQPIPPPYHPIPPPIPPPPLPCPAWRDNL